MAEYFQIKCQENSSRTGILHTVNGDVLTPTFVPVATQGAVKTLTPEDLKSLGASIILANTYHLYLRPGIDVIKFFKGLQNFTNWKGPILTDSGGFQGFSLKHLRKITEEGIKFKSHIDGNLHMLTPELAIEYQGIFNSDIIMPLDVCSPNKETEESSRFAMERTHRWMLRSIKVPKSEHQTLFGIIQGGFYKDLRKESCEFLTSIDVPGYGLGGFSVGESKKLMYDTVEYTTGMLPKDKPRHLLGVGSPEDLVEGVHNGIDLFDCVLPTRIARNSALFVEKGRINISRSIYKSKDVPIEDDCDCYTCLNFSVAYIHHLFKAKELLAFRLASIHNLRYIFKLMESMREAINIGEFGKFRETFWDGYTPPNEATRQIQKEKWLNSLGRR